MKLSNCSAVPSSFSSFVYSRFRIREIPEGLRPTNLAIPGKGISIFSRQQTRNSISVSVGDKDLRRPVKF